MKQIFKKLVLILAMLCGLTVSVHRGVWKLEGTPVHACDWDDDWDDNWDDDSNDYEDDDYYDDYIDEYITDGLDNFYYWYDDNDDILYIYDMDGNIEGLVDEVVITPTTQNAIDDNASLDYLLYLLNNLSINNGEDDNSESNDDNNNSNNNNNAPSNQSTAAKITTAASTAVKTVKDSDPVGKIPAAHCNLGVQLAFKDVFGNLATALDNKTANQIVEYWRASSSWESITKSQAQSSANDGWFTVAGWYNPDGSGHVVVIVPGTEKGGWPVDMDTGANMRSESQGLNYSFGKDKRDDVEYFRYK